MDDLAEHLRDGRRGHEQHVDRAPLGRERLALRDAEPVLLVDHGQPQVGEADALLDERLGAHEQQAAAAAHERGVSGALRERERLAPFRRADAAGEQHHVVAERLQQGAQGRRVLAGEQVGGCQQRRLAAGVGDERHGQRRDRGLARADVTLDEAHHRATRGQIGPGRAARP